MDRGDADCPLLFMSRDPEKSYCLDNDLNGPRQSLQHNLLIFFLAQF